MSIKTSIARLETKHKKSQAGCTQKEEQAAWAREWLDSIVHVPKTAERIKYEELYDKVKSIFNIPEPEVIEDPEKWVESIMAENKCPVDGFVKIIEEGILSCEGLAERLASIRDKQENSNAPVTEEEIIRLKEIVAQDRKLFEAKNSRGLLRADEGVRR